MGMAFNPTQHPRNGNGKFAEKQRTPPEGVELVDPGELTFGAYVRASDEFGDFDANLVAQFTDEGVIVDVFADEEGSDDLAGSWGMTFQEMSDGLIDYDAPPENEAPTVDLSKPLTRSACVLVGDDDRECELRVRLGGDGMYVEVVDDDERVIGSWSRTVQELTDRAVG
jgi:hypothetical protein